MAYFILKTFVLGPLLRVLFRPWVRGIEYIPGSGAAILASNHLSFSDSIFLPLMSRRPVVFLAKSEYFTGKGLKGALTRWFFKATGQLPIDRSGGKADLGVPFFPLIAINFPTYAADELPPELAATPAIKPGSRVKP